MLIVWVFILSSCSINASIEPIPNRIRDVNGNLHYYTMQRLTSFNEPIKYCKLHEQWERIEPKVRN